MSNSNGNKNGKALQGGTAVIPEPKTPVTSTTSVNGNGQLNQAENGKEAEKPVETIPALSVEDKIKKVATLNDQIAKRGVLKSHLDRVDALRFGDYEDKDILTISGSGNATPYTIKSTALCKKIQSLVKDEIGEKIAEVEGQITF